MSRFPLALVAVIMTLLLTSCGLFPKLLGVPTDCEQYTQVLDFESSDRILRGTWTGTIQDVPTEGSERELALDLTASYVDRDSYALSGTFAIEGEDPATFEGTVSGGCAERYERGSATAGTAVDTQDGPTHDVTAQSYPPGIFLDAEVRDGADDLLWTVLYSEFIFVEDRYPLPLHLESTEENPYHRVDQIVEVTRTTP